MIATVYRVTLPFETPKILKISTREADHHRELYFLKKLVGTLPVPRVIDVVEPDPDVHGAILIQEIEGSLLQAGDWTEALAYEVGQTLARLHRHRTDNYGDLVDPDHLTSDSRTYFGQKFEEELAECRGHLPQTLARQCHRYYTSHLHLLADVDGPCMVHRDFRPGNMIVRDGKLQGIIDWAGGRSGFAEQDFCSMEHWECPGMQAHKKALLSGYASIRETPDCNRIMPLLRLGRALAVVGFAVKSQTWETKNQKVYQHNRQYLESFAF